MLRVVALVGLAAAAAAPTPCLPACVCSATSYACISRNLTAFPPDMFSGWTALETINLAGNRASALPPGLFAGLPSLTTLDFSYNNLTSLPAGWQAPVASTVTSLNLAGLPFAAPFDVASVIGAMPSLTFLGVADLTLAGGHGECPDFSPLAKLAPRLATLSAARAQLTRIPPRAFAGLTLASLDLSKNNFVNLTAGAFDGLDVGEVKLEWCGISGITQDAFAGLTAGNVDLYFNQITADSLPDGGLDLPGVTALCLAGNPIDARAFTKPLFASAPRLTGLDMMGGMGLGPFLGTVPARAFASAPALTTLQLFNSGISAFEVGALDGLPHLTFLNIGWNLFSAVPAGLLDPLPLLTTFVVNNGALAGGDALLADAFAKNPLLATLDLSYNNPGITGLPSGLLAGCDKLATIDFSWQSAGTLALQAGTFVGINASGTLQTPVSITLAHNLMKSYAGHTAEKDIQAAVCAEARASPGACSVGWSPQAQNEPGEDEVRAAASV